jgi:4-amino-4-deoxy-L-arabinose transferase-like glycosyltransferase
VDAYNSCHLPSIRASRWWLDVEFILIVCLFCAPLFVGLNNWDLHNDESIYSYAVDRILETNDWLTPRSIPSDIPFLEKPPLKFWIVAGAIRANLLPHNEHGLRFFDALFGAVAFVYVYGLGRWLAGRGCGFVATLLLFTTNALLFDHGLRSNNMDAALFLSYCGGIYHFARWVEDAPSKRRALHTFAATSFFVLGFMTKFVAALFLPLVCLTALMMRSDGVRRARSDWREWVAPAAVALAMTLPWFIYQTIERGDAVVREMLGVHVFDRFTRVLDPGHVQPWHYYFVRLWEELTYAGSRTIAVLGFAMLAVNAVIGTSWLARLVFLWWVVPMALISFASSKVFHYAYPFLPALALGAGWFVVALFRVIEHGIAKAAPDRLRRVARRYPAPAIVRHALFATAIVFLSLAIWTEVMGPIRWRLGDLSVRNSSSVRPLVIGLVLLSVAGARAVLWTATAATIALLLPVHAYLLQAEHVRSVASPLKSLRDCAKSVPLSQRETRVYVPYSRLLNHAFYYYPRQIGPWLETRRVNEKDLDRRLFSEGHQTLVIITKPDYEQFIQKPGKWAPGFELSSDVIMVTPGPFAACGAAAIAAGGTEIGGIHRSRIRP